MCKNGYGSSHPEVSQDVDVEGAFDLVVGALEQRFARHDACVVHQNVHLLLYRVSEPAQLSITGPPTFTESKPI